MFCSDWRSLALSGPSHAPDKFTIEVFISLKEAVKDFHPFQCKFQRKQS